MHAAPGQNRANARVLPYGEPPAFGPPSTRLTRQARYGRTALRSQSERTLRERPDHNGVALDAARPKLGRRTAFGVRYAPDERTALGWGGARFGGCRVKWWAAQQIACKFKAF